MPALPQQNVDLPDCQENWEWLQKHLGYMTTGIYVENAATTDETTTSTTFADTATVGPTVTIPISGTWSIELMFQGFVSVAANTLWMGISVNGAGVAGPDAARCSVAVASTDVYPVRHFLRPRTYSAGTVLVGKYAVSSGTGTYRPSVNQFQSRAILAILISPS
jgi:hypothetical protein